jgi:hypothetical protein
VQTADAGVEQAVPDARAPAVGRIGPLRRALEIGEVEAGGEHVAEHPPGEDRRELAGHDGNHRLVQERDHAGSVATRRQSARHRLQRHRLEVAITELPAD